MSTKSQGLRSITVAYRYQGLSSLVEYSDRSIFDFSLRSVSQDNFPVLLFSLVTDTHAIPGHQAVYDLLSLPDHSMILIAILKSLGVHAKVKGLKSDYKRPIEYLG